MDKYLKYLKDIINLKRKGKVCEESCFQYDPKNEGCAYTRGDFFGIEPVQPGRRCLHPEFDQSQLIEIPLITFCNCLEACCSSDPDSS